MWRANSLEKTLILGNIEGRRRRGVIEDEMVGWHHWLNRHECEQTPGDGEGGVGPNWTAEQQWFQGWFGDSVNCLAFQSKKKGERTIPANSPSSLLLSFFFFFFLNEEANLVPEVPQQTHTYTFTAQTPSWKGDLLTSIVGERKGEVGWLWRAPRSPANTLYCCRNLGLYEVATSRGKMQCIPSFSKDLFEDFLWAGSWW